MIRIVDSTLEELNEIFRLDKLVFSPKWDIPLLDGQNAWRSNPEIYRFIKDGEQIMGYHLIAPFHKEIYELLLSGKMDETSSLPYILKYEPGTEVYLYVYSIVVDISVENPRLYSQPLIHDVVDLLDRLNNRGIVVKDFGFIAITDAGIRLAHRMGLTFIEEFESDEKPNPQAFRSEPKNFKANSIFRKISESK